MYVCSGCKTDEKTIARFSTPSVYGMNSSYVTGFEHCVCYFLIFYVLTVTTLTTVTIIIIRHIGSFVRLTLYYYYYRCRYQYRYYIDVYTRILRAIVVYSQPPPVNLAPLHGEYILTPPRAYIIYSRASELH